MCSERQIPKISHAAAFWIDWRCWIRLAGRSTEDQRDHQSVENGGRYLSPDTAYSYKTYTNVNGCYWNTCKLVFTVTRTQTCVSVSVAVGLGLRDVRLGMLEQVLYRIGGQPTVQSTVRPFKPEEEIVWVGKPRTGQLGGLVVRVSYLWSRDLEFCSLGQLNLSSLQDR